MIYLALFLILIVVIGFNYLNPNILAIMAFVAAMIINYLMIGDYNND